jgi:hypothetical protein
VLGELEDLAAIGPLALEHRTGVVEAVGEHVDLGVRPLHELTVHPDETVELVEWNGCHVNLPRVAARTSFDTYNTREIAAFRCTKTRLLGGRKQIRQQFRRCGLPLPFRAQSVEKLGENYQQAKNMSTRLT